jgi:hypothetical protein
MQKKYQVFISSTFKDLIEERQDTLKSVLDMGHIPSGMEIFPAADVEQFEYIKKIIDECDYYVLIVAARYGSLDAAGVSYTEKEYHYAVSQKKTVLAFVYNDVGNIATNKTDTDQELQKKLAAFRKDVAKSRLVQLWSSREELRAKVIVSTSQGDCRISSNRMDESECRSERGSACSNQSAPPRKRRASFEGDCTV